MKTELLSSKLHNYTILTNYIVGFFVIWLTGIIYIIIIYKVLKYLQDKEQWNPALNIFIKQPGQDLIWGYKPTKEHLEDPYIVGLLKDQKNIQRFLCIIFFVSFFIIMYLLFY